MTTLTSLREQIELGKRPGMGIDEEEPVYAHIKGNHEKFTFWKRRYVTYHPAWHECKSTPTNDPFSSRRDLCKYRQRRWRTDALYTYRLRQGYLDPISYIPKIGWHNISGSPHLPPFVNQYGNNDDTINTWTDMCLTTLGLDVETPIRHHVLPFAAEIALDRGTAIPGPLVAGFRATHFMEFMDRTFGSWNKKAMRKAVAQRLQDEDLHTIAFGATMLRRVIPYDLALRFMQEGMVHVDGNNPFGGSAFPIASRDRVYWSEIQRRMGARRFINAMMDVHTHMIIDTMRMIVRNRAAIGDMDRAFGLFDFTANNFHQLHNRNVGAPGYNWRAEQERRREEVGGQEIDTTLPIFKIDGEHIDDMVVRVPTNTTEVVQWSEWMQHCIWMYADDMVNGTTWLVGLFKGDKLMSTAEIHPSGHVKQHYGKHNSAVEGKYRDGLAMLLYARGITKPVVQAEPARYVRDDEFAVLF